MSFQGEPIQRALKEVELQRGWRRYLSRPRPHEGVDLPQGGGILSVIVDTLIAAFHLALVFATSAAFCFALVAGWQTGILASIVLFAGAALIGGILHAPVGFGWVVPSKSRSPRTILDRALNVGLPSLKAWWIAMGLAFVGEG